MKKILALLAIVILVITDMYGHHAHKMDAHVVEGYYRQMLPDAAAYQPINDKTARAVGKDGSVMGYLGVSSNVGYGGPILVGTVLGQDGAVKQVIILEHKETPSYINKITQAGYFKQYTKKKADDPLFLDYDLDRISGATLSTRAIANSVQEVAHAIAEKELKLTPQKADVPIKVGMKEIVVALLFILSVLMPRFKRLVKHRLMFLGLSALILGFWLNRSLSMGHVSALFLGYFPAPSENLIWYMVLLGALIPALVTGKNVYCTYVCPFCGLQEATHLISRVNLPLGKYLKWFRLVKEVLLFLVLFFAFLFINPSFSSYEPFGTIFGLNGSSHQWYLLFVVLLTSFFYRRLWCLAFCPVGTFLDKVALLGRKIKGSVGFSSRKKPERWM